jgi:uncharacterized membrane protein
MTSPAQPANPSQPTDPSQSTDSSQSPASGKPPASGQPAAPSQARHPSVLAETERRSADVQLRVADGITKFAGSMAFVYAHIVVFAIWMLVVEKSPWPTLTLVVSLEAIFLSTFVMIGQNRQSAFQQAKADHDFVANELELKNNTELTRRIAELTTEIHQNVCRPTPPAP